MSTISALGSDIHCRACDGTGVFIPLELLELERDIAIALQDFPLPDIMGKGQWFFKPRAVVRTLAFMHQKGDVEGRSVVCLAAPTLGVGLSLLQQRAGFRLSLTVLDIDTQVLDIISRSFPSVHVRRYDISDECPDDLREQFDCFVIDPLYAEDHYRVGISRCVQLIGHNHPDKAGYVVIPPEEIAPIRMTEGGHRIPIQLAVFGFLNQMGLCVADFKDNFMEYDTPPAEANILRRRALPITAVESIGEWRSSDLVRVVSTANTHPLVEGSTTLSTRINERERVGVNESLVQLNESTSPESMCRMCMRCFTAHVADQHHRHYTGYWKPEVFIRPMPSWRDEGDQPFEVAPACAAFEHLELGQIVVLKGPAARVIWETLRDIEDELDDRIVLDDLLNKSLPNYVDLDSTEVKRDVRGFLTDLMSAGLIGKRGIC